MCPNRNNLWYINLYLAIFERRAISRNHIDILYVERLCIVLVDGISTRLGHVGILRVYHEYLQNGCYSTSGQSSKHI